jgi:nicotinamidase-related amidase
LAPKKACRQGSSLEGSTTLVTPHPPAAVIDRMVYSAFGNGSLFEFLSPRHVDTLILSGGETDVCVLSTVLSAIDLGNRIILVEALCSSSDESHDAIINL